MVKFLLGRIGAYLSWCYLFIAMMPLTAFLRFIQDQVFEAYYIPEKWRFTPYEILFTLLAITVISFERYLFKKEKREKKSRADFLASLNESNRVQTKVKDTVPVQPKSEREHPSDKKVILNSKKMEASHIILEKDSELESRILTELLLQIKNSQLGPRNKNFLNPETLSRIVTIRPKSKNELSAIKGVCSEAMKLAPLLLKEITIFDLCVASRLFGQIRSTLVLDSLQSVSRNQRKVVVTYMGGSNPGKSRRLEPLYLNSEYVWARCEERDNEIRCFKINCIVMKQQSQIVSA